MPFTLNGVGTHYYGSRNAISRQGVCSSCKRMTTLTSYDTTLYFVVIFVPLIPLGRKRIVDSCASCRRHYVIPYSTFVAQRTRDYAEAESLLAKSPVTEADAIAAMKLMNGYREPEVIHRALDRAEAMFPQSADIHLFIAETYRLLSEFSKAEVSTGRSLALHERDDVRESLAEFQFARGDVDGGRATLAPILNGPSPRPSFAVKLGVEALQRTGRHAEALELLSRVAVVNAAPDVVTQFAKLRATSEKTLERSAIEPERYVVDPTRGVVVRKRVPFQRTKWAIAAVAAAVIAYAGTSFYLGASHKAFLINGLDRAYSVKIDNRLYRLQPHEVMPIRVSEGDIAVAITDPAYTGSPQSVHFATNPLTRPFDGTVLAINPDAQAAIMTVVVVYSPGGKVPDEDAVLHTAEVGCVVDAQYAFENPPASMQLKSNDRDVRCSTATVSTKTAPRQVLLHLADKKDSRAAAYARHLLEWPITDADDGAAAMSIGGKDATMAALKKRLGVRPVEVETHRLYQQVMQATDTSPVALREEYRAMLDADPTNSTLLYLLGRITDDNRAEAISLFQKAQASTPPEPMAFAGEAYLHALAGEFDAALKLTREAKRLQPDRERHAEREWELLTALGRHREALDALPRVFDDEAPDTFHRRLQSLVALGESVEIDSLLYRRSIELTKEYDAAVAADAMAQSKALLAYLRHDERSFAAAIDKEQADPDIRFAAALSRRDLAAAEKLEAGLNDTTGADDMLLYLAADFAGDAARATRHREAALLRLSKMRGDFATLHAWMSGRTTPTADDLYAWPVEPGLKALALTALGVAQPQLREMSFSVAAKFDYSPLYPHEVLSAARAKRRSKVG